LGKVANVWQIRPVFAKHWQNAVRARDYGISCEITEKEPMQGHFNAREAGFMAFNVNSIPNPENLVNPVEKLCASCVSAGNFLSVL
jgi:hypothetical protein